MVDMLPNQVCCEMFDRRDVDLYVADRSVRNVSNEEHEIGFIKWEGLQIVCVAKA